jgi:hypothetical protein
MNDLQRKFFERQEEIELYLSFLDTVQAVVANGGAASGNAITVALTPKHQKVLHASVFLHLYNLVESTVTWSLEFIEVSANRIDNSGVGQLSSPLRKEWVKAVARTSEDLTPDNRLTAALLMCGQLLNMVPPDLKIGKSGGGNWDDDQISDLAKRIGMTLQFSKAVYSGVKRPIRDEMGPLKIVKKMRNELAHGSISFAECGADHSVSELREIANSCLSYLQEFISCVEGYVSRVEFLDPFARPAQDAAVLIPQ